MRARDPQLRLIHTPKCAVGGQANSELTGTVKAGRRSPARGKP
jgi:hypothetical protein